LEEDDESVSAIFWCSRSVTVPSRLIYELLNRVWFYLFLFIFRHCQPSSLTNSILDPHISNCKSEPPQIKLNYCLIPIILDFFTQ
jgi:hypothetical protein